MRRSLLLGACLLFPFASAAAQSWPTSSQQLEAWVRSQFAGEAKVTLRAVLNEARVKGLIRSPRDRHALKRSFRAISRSQGGSRQLLELQPRVLPIAFGPLATTEREYNDTPGYADHMGTLTPAGLSAQGTIASGDSDCYSFDVPVEGTATFNVTTSASSLSYYLFSERGEYLEWGESNIPSFGLPAGRYYIGFDASGPGSYTLNVGLTIQPLPVITPVGSNSYSIGTDPKTFKVIVPSDGRFSLQLSSSGGADTELFLYNSKMRYMFDVWDDSRSVSGVDAGLDAQLPAGTYFVTVRSDAPTTTQFTSAFTAGALPTLACASSFNGTINGEESFDLYRVVTSSSQSSTISITQRGNSIQDSYLVIFDRQMGFLVESDEETPASSMSGLSVTLPSGIFYAASTGYYDFGDYSMNRSCATAATTPALPGRNSGNVAMQATAISHTLTLRNDVPCEVEVTENTLFDAMVGIVDAKTGLSMGQNDTAWHYGSCNVAGPLAAGDYWFLVKDWDGGTGTYDLDILTPLYRGAGNQLRGLDKQNNVIVFLAALGSFPGVNPVPGLTTGNLLVDPLSMITFSVVVPANGKLDYGVPIAPGSGLFLQQISFGGNPLQGVFSNRLD
jgi:hypothetical protein